MLACACHYIGYGVMGLFALFMLWKMGLFQAWLFQATVMGMVECRVCQKRDKIKNMVEVPGICDCTHYEHPACQQNIVHKIVHVDDEAFGLICTKAGVEH